MNTCTVALASSVIWISVLISMTTQEQFVHVVHESNRSSPCPSTAICLEITDLLENASLHLVSETTVLVHPGLHKIDSKTGNILVRDIENLTIRGVSWSTQRPLIHCEMAFGLTFINVSHLTIQNIEMVGCGSEFSPHIIKSINEFAMICTASSVLQFVPCSPRFDITTCAITIVHTLFTSIENVTISDSKETALVVINVHIQLTLRRIYLANNRINCIVATVYPFGILEEFPIAKMYQITDSQFISGNILDSGRKIASGLNVLVTYMAHYDIYVKLRNITAQNNHGWFGNVLLQIDKCPNTPNGQALFDITKVKINQSEQLTNREGISIETIIPLFCFHTEISITNSLVVSLLKFSDITIINTGVHIGIHVQYPSALVNIQFTKLHIAEFAGRYTITMANANVTLTNFKLQGCSNLYSISSQLTIQGTSTMQRNIHVLFLVDSVVIIKGKTAIKDNTGALSIITLQKSILTFEGDTTIDNNTSKGTGCLSALAQSEIHITGNVSITRNKAYNGGAIAIYQALKYSLALT